VQVDYPRALRHRYSPAAAVSPALTLAPSILRSPPVFLLYTKLLFFLPAGLRKTLSPKYEMTSSRDIFSRDYYEEDSDTFSNSVADGCSDSRSRILLASFIHFSYSWGLLASFGLIV